MAKRTLWIWRDLQHFPIAVDAMASEREGYWLTDDGIFYLGTGIFETEEAALRDQLETCSTVQTSLINRLAEIQRRHIADEGDAPASTPSWLNSGRHG